MPKRRRASWRVQEFFSSHKELVVWLGIASVFTFVASLVVIPFICVRMGHDYFMPHRDLDTTLRGRRPVIRWTGLILKNLAGLILFLAGVAMLFLPGQGVITMIIGILLMNFPGKRSFELWLIRIPGILRTINSLRQRAGHPPLELPPHPKSVQHTA